MIEGFQFIGRFLLLFGIVLVLIGGFLMLSDKTPWLGKLPGDIIIQKKNVTLYFPLATCILLSLLLTLIFWLFGRR